LCRLGDVVSLLSDMAAGEQRPDAFTFSAIFNACQRADEAELALEVARWVGPGEEADWVGGNRTKRRRRRLAGWQGTARTRGKGQV
jgi:hypothetical protein